MIKVNFGDNFNGVSPLSVQDMGVISGIKNDTIDPLRNI